MGVLKIYKSYSFIDKDPIIDRLRTALKDSGMSYADVEREGGPTASCLGAWFDGNTKRPQFATAMAAARAMGYDLVLAKDGKLTEANVIRLPQKSTKTG